jgi:hypothetical protein
MQVSAADTWGAGVASLPADIQRLSITQRAADSDQLAGSEQFPPVQFAIEEPSSTSML